MSSTFFNNSVASVITKDVTMFEAILAPGNWIPYPVGHPFEDLYYQEFNHDQDTANVMVNCFVGAAEYICGVDIVSNSRLRITARKPLAMRVTVRGGTTVAP